MQKHCYMCPICNNNELVLRYEASYVYSYVLDEDAPGMKNSEEFLSYLYDRREQKDTRTYVECTHCKTQFPYEVLNETINKKNRSDIEYII